MTVDADVFVGARVDHSGHHGTVKYIGEVPPTQGIWLGVEWDDTSRGKHDGSSKDGTRYFTTEFPTSGSFIRPMVISEGTEFMLEVQERYGIVNDEKGGIVEEEMFVVGKGRQTTVEVVGARKVNLKQSHFDALLEVSLRGTLLSTPGVLSAIERNLPNVVDLDISKCLLLSWETVSLITQQLPKLEILNVSDNRLVLPDEPEQYQKSFCCTKTLFLNRMNYTWSEILCCVRMMPQLKCLHVCFNKIKSLCDSAAVLPCLKLLNLEGNAILDWSEILKLGSLPKLQELILNDTQISAITFPDVSSGETTKFFSVVSALSLNNNNISEWTSIDELNKLQQLTELKFKRNPVLGHQDAYSDRYLTLAKVKRLKLLDRSVIETDERKGAELDYLKKFGLVWKEAGGHQDPQQNKPSAEFSSLHPRYQDLVEKYGAPEDSELKIGSSALKNNLINVTIKVVNDASKKEMKKKLPLSMSVQKLKVLLHRLYRINPGDMKLTYISTEMPDKEVELENDQKEIGFYSIMEGDCVLLHQ